MELKYPIKIIGEKGEQIEIKYLTAGRLKVKHFRLLPISLVEKMTADGVDATKLYAKDMLPMFQELIPFIAGLCNISVETANEIDYEDIEEVVGLLEGVFPKEKK